jgi:hypothetical protein
VHVPYITKIVFCCQLCIESNLPGSKATELIQP